MEKESKDLSLVFLSTLVIVLLAVFSTIGFLPMVSSANISIANFSNYTTTVSITCGFTGDNGIERNVYNASIYYNNSVTGSVSTGSDWRGTLLTTISSNDTLTNTTFTNSSVSLASLTEKRGGYFFWCQAHNQTTFTGNATAHGNSTVAKNITIDRTTPVITVYAPATGAAARYVNTTNKTNTQLLTLNVSVTDLTIGIKDGARCVFDVNGTNQTVLVNKTSSTLGWCNSSRINLTNHADSHRQIRIYVNDTLNNKLHNNSRYVTIDSNGPTMVLQTVTGGRYSNVTNKTNTQLLTLSVTITDLFSGLGDNNYCVFDTNGTNQTVTLTKSSTTRGTCNTTGLNLTNHADAHRQIRIYVNDTLDNDRLNNSRYVTIDSNGPTMAIYDKVTGAGSYVNATSKKNSAQLTLNISVADLFSGIGDNSVCVIDVNGTNQTLPIQKTSTTQGWCNSTRVNLTNHADDNRQIRIYLNDTLDNDRLNQSNYVRIDTTNPSATALCTPAEVVKGSTVTCSCSATDVLSGVSTQTADSTPTTAEEGTFNYQCEATDVAGNSASHTISYTVLGSAGSSSSGGGGGGGGGGATSTNSNIFTKITPGVVSIVKDFDEETGVKEIRIEVNTDAQSVKITVTKYDGKPAAVSVEKSGQVYQYIQIDAQNLADKLDKAVVKFKVEKAWVNANLADKEEIGIFKFDGDNNEWDELETTYSSEDDTYYYYDVELDSFSYFAISEKEVAPTTQEGSGGAATTETASPQERNITWLWVVIVLVGLLVVIALGSKRMKKRR